MPRRQILLALTMVFSVSCCAGPSKVPQIEQGIYQPTEPFENIKQVFYVRERERPLLYLITDASTSIARFLIDTHNVSLAQTTLAMQHVFSGAEVVLRLPPMATTGGNGRYVGSGAYCWKSEEKDHLEFLIEWSDITTNARYTDSYIFARNGPSWNFERHGRVRPWHWTQTERYFQRACPA